jgi:hypothetical protein
MLSRSAEPECRVDLAVISAEFRDTNEVAVRFMWTWLPADDAPHWAPTMIATRATIPPTAETGCRPGATAVN